jgi:hypothetical protein
MFKDIPVKPIRRRLICDKCGGEMSPTGSVLTTNPPQYPHECNCGSVRVERDYYPCIIYEEAKDEL